MKTIRIAQALLFACGFAPAQSQSGRESPESRCGQLTQLVRLLRSTRGPILPQVRIPNEACEKYTASLKNREVKQSREALTEAGLSMDRFSLTADELFRRQSEAVRAADPLQRFYALADLAKEAFSLGHIDAAAADANELLQEATQYSNDWNYGNAVYFGNFVLGRIVLQHGDLESAGKYLIAASKTTGSPQLDSFGPNITLAKELLEKGQRKVVIQFFTNCKSFWKMDRGKLEEWIATIRGGGIPHFTQNLDY